MIEPREALLRFGSFKEVAALLGVSHSTVLNWPSRGIPVPMRLRLLRLAEQRGVELSEEEILEPELLTTSRKSA